ncbi:MAG: SPFH domain-containing protein [Planctomycetota bacterium]
MSRSLHARIRRQEREAVESATGEAPVVGLEAETAPEEHVERSWLDRVLAIARRIPGWLRSQLIDFAQTHPAAAGLAIYGFFRALATTVRTGQEGLKFSFGRATRTLEPGLHFMIPFLQIAKVLPVRSRTLDLEDQRVATLDGLVYRVHATLVWRIVDVRKAWVEVDDLIPAMRNALATSVWQVLKDRERATVRGTAELDEALAARMEERLEPWGVVVERTGFQSIAPFGPTLDLLQLRQRVHERERVGRALAAGLLGDAINPGAALGLVGTPRFPVRRQRRSIQRAAVARRRRLLIRQARGWRLREKLDQPLGVAPDGPTPKSGGTARP